MNGGAQQDPGYIAAYPPGVRENGGQYTHAACWYLIALAKRGDAARAKALLNALMPYEHAKDAQRYKVEPYVVAADIYSEPPYSGMGGWTWYTGSAGWLMQAVLRLMGFERRGDRVRLNALRGIWDKPQLRLRYGNAVYTLVSNGSAAGVTLDGADIQDEWLALTDDGREHTCVFPMREG